MLYYQMESDSPAGATSNNCITSEMKYYRRVQYTLALMCAKNRRIIFCSLLDIRENVLLDIRENVEWPHFFWPTLYNLLANFQQSKLRTRAYEMYY